MKIVRHRDDWHMDHPTGAIAFHYMLQGDPASPDNFMYVLTLRTAISVCRATGTTSIRSGRQSLAI